MGDDVMIRPYREDDERGWVVCRLLSFLDTAFFDDVRRSKARYEHPAIELVAERNGEIVGLLDAECEEEPGTVFSKSSASRDARHGAPHDASRRHGRSSRPMRCGGPRSSSSFHLRTSSLGPPNRIGSAHPEQGGSHHEHRCPLQAHKPDD